MCCSYAWRPLEDTSYTQDHHGLSSRIWSHAILVIQLYGATYDSVRKRCNEARQLAGAMRVSIPSKMSHEHQHILVYIAKIRIRF